MGLSYIEIQVAVDDGIEGIATADPQYGEGDNNQPAKKIDRTASLWIIAKIVDECSDADERQGDNAGDNLYGNDKDNEDEKDFPLESVSGFSAQFKCLYGVCFFIKQDEKRKAVHDEKNRESRNKEDRQNRWKDNHHVKSLEQ